MELAVLPVQHSKSALWDPLQENVSWSLAFATLLVLRILVYGVREIYFSFFSLF